MRRRLGYWVLAALLATGQLALLAHQSDIEAHADGESCSVCLFAHGNGHALPSLVTVHLDTQRPALVSAADFSCRIQHTNTHQQIRGPPACTRYS